VSTRKVFVCVRNKVLKQKTKAIQLNFTVTLWSVLSLQKILPLKTKNEGSLEVKIGLFLRLLAAETAGDLG
jgi:hypothetical protein